MTSSSFQSARQLLYRLLRRAGMVRHLAVGAYLSATIRGVPKPAAPVDGGSCSRILIIRLDDIGDFVLTTPLLRAIRHGFPDSHITLLMNSRVASLANNCPYVDDVIEFGAVKSRPPFEQIMSLVRAKRFAKRELANRGFECALMPRADIDNASALAMAYYAKIPVRIGYSERVLPLKRVKNAGYRRFLTHSIDSIRGRHEVEWSLNLARAMGVRVNDQRLELWPADASNSWPFPGATNAKGKGLRWVAIAPGANLDRRRWPVSGFVEVARAIINRQECGVVVIGGPTDERFGRSIVAESCVGVDELLDLTGKLSLEQTASVLSRCQLFIGNDSGPLHIAAAMGVPCVEISCHPKNGGELASNSPARFSPWGVKHEVLQPANALAPCVDSCVKTSAHCIGQITVDQVYAAACKLLEAEEPASVHAR